MKQPNFFIIGAPKCGTTSMAAWLDEHPQIFMSDPKEPTFFCSDIKIPGAIKTLEQYLEFFNNAGDTHLAVGEASVIYLLSHVAVKKILEFNSDAKFIVMLRNPIEMAPSWHGQLLLANTGETLEDFEEDWKAHLVYNHESGKLNRRGFDPIYMEYVKVCKIGEQVQRLLQTVDAKSVLFIVLDDLINDSLHEYQRVLAFLNIPYDGRSQFSIHNPAKRAKYRLIQDLLLFLNNIKRFLGIKQKFGLLRKIYDANIKPHKTMPLRPEFRQELIEVFREDVNLLSTLLGRDFSHWLL